MAKLEWNINGDFDLLLEHIHRGIIGTSISATYEDGSDWRDGDIRVAVRVYERYSWIGGNRVSLSVTIAGNRSNLFVSAVTSGGSQAMFFKVNRFGEKSFLGKLEDLVSSYSG